MPTGPEFVVGVITGGFLSMAAGFTVWLVYGTIQDSVRKAKKQLLYEAKTQAYDIVNDQLDFHINSLHLKPKK